MSRPATGKLLRKLLLATLLPTLLALALFGVLAHEVARRTLEDELGKRLGAVAAGTAALILPQQISAITEGDEGLATYANLLRRLDEAKQRFGVRRVALVARDLTGRGDTDRRIALGAPAHELGADRIEIEQAASGAPASSPLFWGLDGLPYKRGYAAVGAPQATGFVVVEGSADYFVALAAFRRWLLAGGVLGLGCIVLLTSGLARRITGPVGRLTEAAERIGRGDLAASVAVETRDEVGLLAARLDEMRAALRARDERLQMMLAGIAHEVRNPLGGLELYAGLLREALVGNPDRLAEVARIEREIGHLNAVVNEFLDYARRPAIEATVLSLLPLLTEVAEVSAGAGVRVEVDGDLQVMGDRTQLRRAFMNLARNAATAAGPTGKVVLAARRVQGAVECEVRDNGAGVSDDLKAKIFAPFFTTREKGTGLGLAFARDIVRDHGGDLAVDRAAEGGARFWFRLPAGG